MNYEQMSDFEINKRVATCLKMDWRWEDASVYTMDDELFDPCNNPSDAWPLIVENGLTINAKTKWARGLDSTFCIIEHKDENPLRAAMIVYLMIQDGE